MLSVYSVFAIGRFRPVRDPHRSRATCAEFWQTFSEAFLLKFYGGPGVFGGGGGNYCFVFSKIVLEENNSKTMVNRRSLKF